jgi:hypothetical protein
MIQQLLEEQQNMLCRRLGAARALRLLHILRGLNLFQVFFCPLSYAPEFKKRKWASLLEETPTFYFRRKGFVLWDHQDRISLYHSRMHSIRNRCPERYAHVPSQINRRGKNWGVGPSPAIPIIIDPSCRAIIDLLGGIVIVAVNLLDLMFFGPIAMGRSPRRRIGLGRGHVEGEARTKEKPHQNDRQIFA